MTKVVIELPESYLHRMIYTVQSQDVNRGDHLAADRVLSIAIEAMKSCCVSLGYSDMLDIEGVGTIMVDSACVYTAEADLNDELQIDIAIPSFGDKAIELVYRMVNITKQCELAKVKTSVLFFDYKLKKVVSIPQGFREKITT